MKIPIVVAVAVLAAITITGLSACIGWAMDQSLMPLSGGGWRCYFDCIAFVWAVPLSVAGLAIVPAFCRWLARILAS